MVVRSLVELSLRGVTWVSRTERHKVIPSALRSTEVIGQQASLS